MQMCSCGNKEFFARQQVHNDVVVDGNNNWISTVELYFAYIPYGPFVCTDCGIEYDDLEELEHNEDSD